MHRRGFFPVLLAALAVAALAPAGAGGAVRYEEKVTGEVTATWAGDPARGCAEAGVCEISGAVTVRPVASGGGESSGDDPEDGALSSLYLNTPPAVARVLRGPLHDPAGACTDVVSAEFALEVDRVRGGLAQVLLVPFGIPRDVPLGGRCAGPLASDLEDVLLTATVERRRLVEGVARLDFGGTRRFSGGPFSGEVRSTLVVERRSRRVRDSEPIRHLEPRRARPRRVALVHMSYDVARLRGALLTEWSGSAEPFCQALDACGLSGTHALALARGGRGSRLDVFATVPVRRLRAPTREAAIAALRSGRARPDGATLQLEGRALATASWAGGPACRDATRPSVPIQGAVRRGALRLALRAEDDPDHEHDPLRTRCPGPGSADLGGATLASGAVPLRRLGARRLGLTLRAGRGPASGAFTVTQRGALALALRRSRVYVELFTTRWP